MPVVPRLEVARIDAAKINGPSECSMKVTEVWDGDDDVKPGHSGEGAEDGFGIVHMLQHMEAGNHIEGLGAKLYQRIGDIEHGSLTIAARQLDALGIRVRALNFEPGLGGEI